MTKIELARAIQANVQAKGTTCSLKESELFIDSFVEVVGNALQAKDHVQLVGFGTFRTVVQAARSFVLPGQKKSIKVGPKNKVSFSAGKFLKEKVNTAKTVKPAKKIEKATKPVAKTPAKKGKK